MGCCSSFNYTVYSLPRVRLVPSLSTYLLTQMYLGGNVFNITLVLPRYRGQQKLIHENTLKILVKSLENTLLKQNMRHRLTKWTNVESPWPLPYKHKNYIVLETVAECGSWAETSLTRSFPWSNINPLNTQEEWQRLLMPTYFTNIRRARTTTWAASLTVWNCVTFPIPVPIPDPNPRQPRLSPALNFGLAKPGIRS